MLTFIEIVLIFYFKNTYIHYLTRYNLVLSSISNAIMFTCMLTCLSFEVVDEIKSAESLQFTFTTIRDATKDFSEKNMVGQGGFGAVYKVVKDKLLLTYT